MGPESWESSESQVGLDSWGKATCSACDGTTTRRDDDEQGVREPPRPTSDDSDDSGQEGPQPQAASSRPAFVPSQAEPDAFQTRAAAPLLE